MKIAMTGAHGFIGSNLGRRFPEHVAIDRNDTVDLISEKIKGIDCVINLAGAPIIKRWNNAYKEVLWASRIGTTRKIVSALEKTPVRFFISMSAVGIYQDGISCDEDCVEFSRDFLGILAQAWEKEARKAPCPTAIFRLGIVLGKESGALQKMLWPFRLGLGGPIGDGSMMMSWIHKDDLIDAISFVMERGLTGVFNAVSPSPVTNKEFTKALSSVLKRPAFVSVPIILLKVMYGDAACILVASKIAHPKRLLEAGFMFNHPTIEGALMDLLR